MHSEAGCEGDAFPEERKMVLLVEEICRDRSRWYTTRTRHVRCSKGSDWIKSFCKNFHLILTGFREFRSNSIYMPQHKGEKMGEDLDLDLRCQTSMSYKHERTKKDVGRGGTKGTQTQQQLLMDDIGIKIGEWFCHPRPCPMSFSYKDDDANNRPHATCDFDIRRGKYSKINAE